MRTVLRAVGCVAMFSLAVCVTGCSAGKEPPKGSEPSDPNKDKKQVANKKGNDPTPKGTEGTPPKNTDPTLMPEGKKDTDPAQFPTAIIGKWEFETGASGLPLGFLDPEFTNDGRVLVFDNQEKKWNEHSKYRFEKAELILTVPDKKGGNREDRMTIGRISAERLSVSSPQGSFLRKGIVLPKEPAPKPDPMIETDPAKFPMEIIGRWRFVSGASGLPLGFLNPEFTKDGRVLIFDKEEKKWIDHAKYRFEKAELLLTFPKKDGGERVEKMTIASISFEKLVVSSPMGEFRRVVD